MASADEAAMGGESSSDPLSPDDDEHQQADNVTKKVEKEKDEDSSSISSEDSFESDLESESFTDVTPLHSISNSPLPSQPINTAVTKVRDSLGHTDEENTGDDSSSASSSDDGNLRPRNDRRSCDRVSGEVRKSSKILGKVSSRRATVKRAPNRGNVLQQNGTSSVEPIQLRGQAGTGEVAHLTDAIQRLGLRSCGNNNDTTANVRSRRQRELDRRLEVENEHILKRIIAQQSKVAELVSASSGALSRVQHVAPSTVNRERQQKYIHAQNLALHKRIEAARNGAVGAGNGATPGGGSSRKPVRVSMTASTQLPNRQRRDSR